MNEPTEPGSVEVVGTAHVSAESAAAVERAVEEADPDVVAVELDEGRYRQLKGETPDDLDPSDLLRGSIAFQLLAYWLLSYVQSRLGDRFDIEPGADMRAGVEAAERTGAEVALVDRDIQTTIQRFWARMTATEKLRLVGQLGLGVADGPTLGLGVGLSVGLFVGVAASALAGPLVVPAGATAGLAAVPVVGALAGVATFLVDVAAVALAVGLAVGTVVALVLSAAPSPDEEVEAVDLEDLTDGDVVSALLEEFRQFSPGGASALIDERDAFIAHNLVDLRTAGHDVVAVVGAGHEQGIEKYLANPETLPPRETLVGREGGGFSVGKALGYLLTLGFLVFFGLLVLAGIEQTVLLKVFAAWFLFNGVIAFGLAKLAGAHWTSAAVGGGVAWLTSLNPLLAPGWFAGYVELRRRPVNVADIGTLNELLADEERPIPDLVSEMLSVPLFRLIAVVAMTNIGSMIASVLFPVVVLPALGGPFDSVGAVTAAMQRGLGNGLDLLVRVVT